MSLSPLSGAQRERIRGTQPGEVVADSYYVANFLRYRTTDVLAGRYRGDPLSYDGFYRIQPEVDGVPPFWYKLHVGKRHRRDRVMGRYENEVMESIVEYLDEDSTFWEVGAYRGYFSLALASVVDEVVAFEARDYAIENLGEAAAKNEYENMTTVSATLGPDNSIDSYLDEVGVPDVLLMDIEGWEYDVLQSAPELLESEPTMIIELHAESGWKTGQVTNPKGETETVDSPSVVSPAAVEELLEEHGYEIDVIHRRRKSNWHVVATAK